MSADATEWAIDVRALRKTFRSGWREAPFVAVAGLNLRVRRGEVLGLLGPNGSGKSTTLKILAGLIAPTAGSATIFGQVAGSDAARGLVGYLPEAPQFPAHQTGREFLRYCAGLSSLPAAQAARRVADVIAWSGLGSAADRRLAAFSKGMRQKIGLAQALLHEPAVVLLDEPASGLDPEGRVALGELIRDLAAQGRTVLFSSHLLAQAEAVCDRVAILGGGRLLAEGAPADLLGAVPVAVGPVTPLERLYLEKVRNRESIGV